MRFPTISRAYWQISIRTMLLLVALICVGLAILMERARQQQAAVNALRANGGAVFYEHEHDGNFDLKFSNPLAKPASFGEQVLGPDAIHDVVSVYIGYGDLRAAKSQASLFQTPATSRVLSAQELAPLKSLPKLKSLFIHDELDSDALALIAELPNIEILGVKGKYYKAPELQKLRERKPDYTLFLVP